MCLNGFFLLNDQYDLLVVWSIDFKSSGKYLRTIDSTFMLLLIDELYWSTVKVSPQFRRASLNSVLGRHLAQ